MRLLTALTLKLVCLGCATNNLQSPLRFTVQPKWARSTLQKSFYGGKRPHRFQTQLTDELIIQANAVDGVVAYDRATLAERWRFDVAGGAEGGGIAAGGQLFLPANDGYLYSLDLESGNVAWRFWIKMEGLARPTLDRGVLYVLSGSNVLYALEADSGKMLWLFSRRESSNFSVRGGSTPRVVGDKVIVGFSDGTLVALRKRDGGVVWERVLNRNRRFRDIDSSIEVDGDRLFAVGFDDRVYCVKLEDGQPLWTIEHGGFDGVVLSENQLFLSSSDGKLIAADKSGGKILWSQSLGGVAVQPVVLGEAVLVGEFNGPLRFFDKRSGRPLGSFDPGWGVASIPTPDPKLQNRVYIMSAAGNLYAVEFAWRRQSLLWPWEGS